MLQERASTPAQDIGGGRAAAGQKKERSGLQSGRDELIDKGAIHHR
jgi:hypothetical protein